MQVTTTVSDRLREVAADPMWADHAEVSKATLLKAASAIEVLARLLAGYVADDEDTATDFGHDEWPDPVEARKIEALALLDSLGVKVPAASA